MQDEQEGATALLGRLKHIGVRLAAEDGDLRISAPPGVLNDDLRERIRLHKAKLMELLQHSSGDHGSPDIYRAARDRSVLSPLQERFWLLEKIEAIGAANNVPMMMRLKGRLDQGALEQSLGAIVERHETLRTRIRSERGKPFQIIEPTLDSAWLHCVDLSSQSRDSRAAAVQERVDIVLRTPFDLGRGALIRVEIVKLAEREHLLLVAIHHLVSDGWSMNLFISELEIIYNALVRGLPPSLPALPVQYADYSAWEKRQQDSPARKQHLGYWRHKLRHAPARMDVPPDRPRPDVQNFLGSSFRFTYPAELLAGLKKLSQQNGATLFMTLLATLQALLGRLCGQDDVLVGSPITSRPLPELEKLIGFFVNTLAFRADLSGDPTFRTLLTQVKETAIEAYAHRDVPFEAIVAAIRPVPDRSRSVLQVMLSLHNEPHRQPQFEGLSASLDVIQTPTTKSDLSFNFHEGDAELVGRIEYATGLFDETTIQWLAEKYGEWLQAIVQRPDCTLSQMPPATRRSGESSPSISCRVAAPDADQPKDGDLGTDLATVEAILAGVWAEALDLPSVHPGDNFFALGGQSIVGLQVISRIFETTGVDLPVRVLFETSSLREMATYVAREWAPVA